MGADAEPSSLPTDPCPAGQRPFTVLIMGASGWSYFVEYQPDLQTAFEALQAKVFADGDYWWAVPGEWDKTAADYPHRPRTREELFNDDRVQESGTHSILDMDRVLPEGEPPHYGWLAAAQTLTSPTDLDQFFAKHTTPDFGTVTR